MGGLQHICHINSFKYLVFRVSCETVEAAVVKLQLCTSGDTTAGIKYTTMSQTLEF